MSRSTTLVLALVIAHALAGCEARPDAKSVSYYLTHPAEREQLMAACKANGEALESDTDCTNAGKAWLARWVVRPVAASAPGAAIPARAAASSKTPVTMSWTPRTDRPLHTN